MQKKHLLLLLVLYIAATGVTYGVIAKVLKKSSAAPASSTSGDQTQQVADQKNGDQGTSALGKLLTVSPSDPRDQICPLNGKKYTQAEKDRWSQRRPLAVMIENSPDARPQSGLTHADLAFEAMAEGGVTRFMAVFYCDVQTDDNTLA